MLNIQQAESLLRPFGREAWDLPIASLEVEVTDHFQTRKESAEASAQRYQDLIKRQHKLVERLERQIQEEASNE
jgi:hypothetical protein